MFLHAVFDLLSYDRNIAINDQAYRVRHVRITEHIHHRDKESNERFSVFHRGALTNEL